VSSPPTGGMNRPRRGATSRVPSEGCPGERGRWPSRSHHRHRRCRRRSPRGVAISPHTRRACRPLGWRPKRRRRRRSRAPRHRAGRLCRGAPSQARRQRLGVCGAAAAAFAVLGSVAVAASPPRRRPPRLVPSASRASPLLARPLSGAAALPVLPPAPNPPHRHGLREHLTAPPCATLAPRVAVDGRDRRQTRRRRPGGPRRGLHAPSTRPLLVIGKCQQNF